MKKYELLDVDKDIVYDVFYDNKTAFKGLAIADQFEPWVNHGIHVTDEGRETEQ